MCELSAGQADALAYEIALGSGPRKIRQVAGLAAPASVGQLCDLWIEHEALDGKAFADAIRCAALAVKTVSSYEKVELLYTGPGNHTMRRNLQGLLEVIRGAHESLWVISFVVAGIDEVLLALEERALADVEVSVLVDHKPDGYELTLQRITQLAPHCQVYIWPDVDREEPGKSTAALHAKCAVADGRQAFVSSANLTGKAMDRNLEVGYLVTGGATPLRLAAHLDDLRANGIIGEV